MNELITTAITGRRLLEFSYGGHERVVEPHVLGLFRGKRQVLTYQVGGTSSSGIIPEWRRFDVEGMAEVRMSPEHFSGPRDYSTFGHSHFDAVLAVVR